MVLVVATTTQIMADQLDYLLVGSGLCHLKAALQQAGLYYGHDDDEHQCASLIVRASEQQLRSVAAKDRT